MYSPDDVDDKTAKGNFGFGSSSSVVPLEDHPLSYIGEGDVKMMEMEHENQFGAEQAYGHPPEQQGYSLCNLRAENKYIKAKCKLAFSSNNSMLMDLNKSKQHEVDLSKMLSKVYKEKTDLTEDLGWVLKKGILRALKRVFKSDEFQ
ncbi:hypothetical protein Tco_1023528 [Tanacetum coccineum]